MSGALPDLFARALELDEPARRAFLDELSRRDPELAAELLLLLENAGATDSPLDRAPIGPGDDSEALDRRLPERIGPYRIVRELGRGGMGRVFLAEEKTEDFERTVALKVIDRPVFDEEALRRFRDEVRILSSLEHPGIARFLNGGRSPEGAWFLALEHVDGVDLLAWARERALSVRQRIELFLHALEAVRFAHTRGVVHRDLKPSHILVDREGRPRLLDFGISKLVDPETHASLAVTRTGSRALTPAYASPEQFRGEPVTPASDVYSLGAILYELLAGRRPFSTVQGSAIAFERAVLETDPEPPSTAARDAPDGETPRAGASPRATPRLPLMPRGELSRDLDAICLKALRKLPAERYAGAGALASDLLRHLEGLPVDARKGDRRYRLSRFARRHRGRLAVSAALLVAVAAVGIAVESARRSALRSPPPPAPRPFPFSDAGSLPVDELRRDFAASPGSVETGATLALHLIKAHNFDEARLVLARLRQIPGADPDPLVDYVEASLAMDMEEPQRALVLFTRARDGALAGGRGELVAQIRATRGRLLSNMGERDEARSEMELALRDFEAAADPASLSRVLNDLAIEELQAGRLAEGQALLERAIVEARAAGKTPGTMLANLAMLSIFRGRPDLAEPTLREVLEIRRDAGNPRQLGEVLGVLAQILHDLGRPGDAETAAEESIRLLRETGNLAFLQHALLVRGIADVRAARFDRVEAIAAELESGALAAGGYVALANAHSLRARVGAARDDSDAMRGHFAAARRLMLQNGELDQVAVGDADQARIELRAGDAAAARRAAEDAKAALPESAAAGEPAFLSAATLACLDAREGRIAESRGALEALGDASARSPSVTRRLAFLQARAALAAAELRFDDARADFGEAIATARRSSRKLDELDLRLDLALFELSGGAGGAAAATRGIEREAEELGLAGIAARAAVIRASG